VLRFPHADASRRHRAHLSVLLRCEGQLPQRLLGEQNGATVPSIQVKPGLWRLQVDPWEPVMLDAFF
jgi:hypothetical protein